MRCSECAKEIPEGSVVCPFCATPQADAPTSLSPDAGGATSPSLDDAATSLEMPPTSPGEALTSASSAPTQAPYSASDPSGQHGRFLPGTTVAERYRIVGLLGRGGMGEVYRADDLKLGQQVALKFLPGSMVADSDAVVRLFDEVRTARKVSHPNVCRVFDVGETDGLHYVSMEYVDGEDLSSLLRRIGRLPEDKAVEIARQLCAALAAAHDEGILHRDLKPANVMVDGRGRVKLTDFGLSAVAEVRAGTPIYMAPEQLAGTEVSIKSDLYSLGLVLHEVFTGKRVFEADDFNELSRLHQEFMRTSLTTTARLDPAVDRIIHRCLDKDPTKRPKSALAVAAGLPGADPLAAALAAGETPSPEMVAEAGGEGTLSLALALPLLLFTLVGALTVGYLQSTQGLTNWVPLDRSPAVLDVRAHEVAAELGYPDEYADTAGGFTSDLGYLQWLRSEEATPERLHLMDEGRTGTIAYWWRGSSRTLVPSGPAAVTISGSVSLTDPPQTSPGMVALQLDTLGRLTWFDAVPDAVDLGEAPEPVDWAAVFGLMGLDIGQFTAVNPRLTPDHFATERRAWEGAWPEAPDSSVRIAAAAAGGRLVSLRIFAPHKSLDQLAFVAGLPSFGLATAVALFVVAGTFLVVLTAIFGGLFVAQRNVRTGRGDTRGARRLGTAMAVALGASWLIGEHTYTPNDINELLRMLIFAGALGGLTWALYLAVEPFMRRNAPEALIGWTRCMDGGWNDPLVARHILLGCAAGVASRLLDTIPLSVGDRVATAGAYVGLPLGSATAVIETVAATITIYVLIGLGMSFLYGLSFVATGRRPWVAYIAWVVFFAAPGFVPGLTINGARPSATWLTATFWLLGWALGLFVLFRLGMVVFLVMTTTSVLLTSVLPTLDFSAWYASSMVAGLVLLFAVAGYAFFRCVAWRGGLAEALGAE